MGVDYTGHYGIGIQIENVDFEDENKELEFKDFDDIWEYLEEKLNEDEYSYFEVGEASYCGGDNDLYIEIVDVFNYGLNNLEEQKNNLLIKIKELGLETKGDFGLVGGLEVH